MMKVNLFFILSLCLSPFFAQSAELKAGVGVEFLAINGQNIEKFGEDADKVLDLRAGYYQIVARYEHGVGRGSAAELFTSSPFLLDIYMQQDDMTLSIPEFRSIAQAKAFFNQPKWQLTSEGLTQTIASELLISKGFAPYADIEKALVFHQSQKTPSQIKAVTAKDTAVTDNLTKLKYWYNQASYTEKKAFNDWVSEQNTN